MFMYNIKMRFILNHVAFWGAVIGATLIALHLPWSGWAFIPYIMSNTASLILLKECDGPKALIYQCIFFMFINFIGIGRWLL